jgi:hypothetical protein
MLVLGLPVSSGVPGWIGSDDVDWLIAQLQLELPYHDQFGGVMAWAADNDNGTWNQEVWYALTRARVRWYAWDNAPQGGPQGCLDGANPNQVRVTTCQGLSTQYWQFSANYIVNYQTNQCLDIGGGVHTQACIPGDLYQNWKFYGNVNGGATIINNWSLFTQQQPDCLDAGQNPPNNLYLSCNGGTYQSWWGGSEW